MKKLLLPMTVVGFIACSTTSELGPEEVHQDIVGFQLESQDSIYVNIYADEVSLESPVDSVLEMVVSTEMDFHLKTLCENTSGVDHCEEDHADHADEDHADHSDEDHDDHDDHEGELELQISVSDTSIASVEIINSEEYEIKIHSKKAGTTEVQVEFWHGSHLEVSPKSFQILVEES